MKDPKKLKEQKPDYSRDKSGADHPDVQPQIATDPMSLPQTSKEKTVVSPDPEKVREHDRERGPQPPDTHKG